MNYTYYYPIQTTMFIAAIIATTLGIFVEMYTYMNSLMTHWLITLLYISSYMIGGLLLNALGGIIQ